MKVNNPESTGGGGGGGGGGNRGGGGGECEPGNDGRSVLHPPLLCDSEFVTGRVVVGVDGG